MNGAFFEANQTSKPLQNTRQVQALVETWLVWMAYDFGGFTQVICKAILRDFPQELVHDLGWYFMMIPVLQVLFFIHLKNNLSLF